jgi:hypothetical protein
VCGGPIIAAAQKAVNGIAATPPHLAGGVAADGGYDVKP